MGYRTLPRRGTRSLSCAKSAGRRKILRWRKNEDHGSAAFHTQQRLLACSLVSHSDSCWWCSGSSIGLRQKALALPTIEDIDPCAGPSCPPNCGLRRAARRVHRCARDRRHRVETVDRAGPNDQRPPQAAPGRQVTLGDNDLNVATQPLHSCHGRPSIVLTRALTRPP